MGATSQPAAVVPTLAPNTRPNPCVNVSRPALTRPIVVIVVALEDCTRSVMMAPHMAPLIGVAVALLSAARSEEPASAFKPPVMTVLPSRNRPTPPRTEIAVDTRALSQFARIIKPRLCLQVTRYSCIIPVIRFVSLRGYFMLCEALRPAKQAPVDKGDCP